MREQFSGLERKSLIYLEFSVMTAVMIAQWQSFMQGSCGLGKFNQIK